MIDNFGGDNGFLSNFYTSPIMLFGRMYLTVEHYYQAMKATTMEDHERIRGAASAGEAKQLGNAVDMRQDWEHVKLSVMREALVKKFEDPILREKLVATGTTPLVEGNTWHDNFWGDCLCPRCKNKRGYNVLGIMLMELRSIIVHEDKRKERENA